MKKQGQSEGVKGKVLSGFFLILFLALGAVFAVIQLASQLSPPDSGVSQSVIKLTLVSNMLSELIEADGQARAYITTGERHYLSKYRKKYEEIKKLADSLKYSSTLQPEQYKRMLVVDSLLTLKKRTLESFFLASNASEMLKISKMKSLGIPEGSKDTAALNKRSELHPSAGKQSPEKEAEADSKNVFQKLWNNITGRKPGRDSLQKQVSPPRLAIDTLNAYTSLKDSTLEMVKSQLLRMGEKERLERQMNVERELLLLKTNQGIMDEIRNVLLLFENEEINRAIEGAGHSRKVLQRLWYTALVLTSVGLFTMLVFVILIWKDLARSAFYRKQLEKARVLAERLLKVKEQFLANMSHEIRTPITSIIGFTERLSGTRLSKEQNDYLNYINSSSEHLLGLVDDLLDYSRIESGKFNLESIPFSPSELLQHAFETMSHKAEARGLTMHYTGSLSESVVLTGDPLRIRQIIYNLLNNSIKFTERGSVTLCAEAQSSGDKTWTLILSVEDTGIGIPVEKQQEIFEEFTQVDAGITRRYGGSGLGLAICRKLTELMDGSIKLASNTGQGTKVTVELPLEVYEGSFSPVKLSGTRERPDLQGIRILLAEDDPTTRILISDSLRSLGATVDEAGDGLQAWDAFTGKQGNYQLVMTDIQMPQMSGPELASMIGKYIAENGITRPAVMGLTAHAMPEELSKFRESGIDAFLIKPFKGAQLDELLYELLKAHPLRTLNTGIQQSGERRLNLETFMQFAGNDQEALGKILVSLADNLQKTSAEMQEAFDNGHIDDLAMLAHRMLPNVRNLGAGEEIKILQKLESLRNQSIIRMDEVSSALNKLRQGMKEIERTLRNGFGSG